VSESLKVDLDLVGAAITAPDADAQALALAHLGIDSAGEDHAGRGHGRLADLAAWWAGVRGDAGAAAPTRIGQLCGPDPASLTAGDPDARRIVVPGGHLLAAEPGSCVDGTVGAALRWGLETADELADAGTDLVLLTLGDPLAARVVVAELMGLDAIESAGWPAGRGLDDQTWMREVLQLRDGLARTDGTRGDLTALLEATGSPAIAAAAAAVVQLTCRRVPLLLDGFGAAAAALVARRTSYTAARWWQAVDAGADPLHTRTLASLNLTPLTQLGLTSTDGTGASVGRSLLTQASTLLAQQ
jgi:nicotinate-nucleotide--dimethylbenzimidazole phosphoribosyltransferase